MTDRVENIEEFHFFDEIEAPWDRLRMVAPLVVIGSKGKENYDLAPKHLAMPLGWDNYFCFVCAPHHQTYKNIDSRKEFTVSYIMPDQIVLASLMASPKRSANSELKDSVQAVPTINASKVDSLLLKDSYLFLECKLHSLVDGFGKNSLVIGKVVKSYARSEFLIDSDLDGGDQVFDNPLLAYLSPDRFASINASSSFPFPKNFRK